MNTRTSFLLAFIVQILCTGAHAGLLESLPDLKCSPKKKVACESKYDIRPQTKLSFLSNGKDSLALRLKMIENAKISIRTQALIFKGDESGWAIAKRMVQAKKERGVTVQINVDGPSNMAFGKSTAKLFQYLEAHGIPVLGSQFKRDEDLVGLNLRYHEKMLLVDAEDLQLAQGITGGLNFANEYFRIAEPAKDEKPQDIWRDQDIVVQGEITKDLKDIFDRNYAYMKSRRAPGPIPEIPDLPKTSDLDGEVEALAKSSLDLEVFDVRARALHSRPRLKEDYIAQTYIDLIDAAQNEILIANAYFIPVGRLRRALRRAAARNVRVVIINNSVETNDIPQMTHVGRYFYQGLMKGDRHNKMFIYEWRGDRFGEMTMHSKFMVIDSQVGLVGSFNLDPRSFKINSENAIVFEGESAATHLRNLFLKDLEKSEIISQEKAHLFHKPKTLKGFFNLYPNLLLKDLF